jgi:two-component system, NarL family, nitrate/nitrite response regulator NarL
MKREEMISHKIRVLVIDGSFIHTQLLSDALRRDEDLEVFSCNPPQAAKFLFEHNIDVLVISANLEGQSFRGLELLRELRASRPEVRSLILLDSSKPEAVLEVFRAGARGVFSRQEPLSQLSKCIRCVHSGQIWAKSHEMALALEALASAPALQALDANGLNLLSKREMEIVECVAEGLTNREIAERLRLSRHTIKNSLFRIFDKLGVSNRLELLLMTLSRQNSTQSIFSNLLRDSGALEDQCKLEECQRAAEEGSLIAQLLLAQLYATRGTGPGDNILAYKWYLVAASQLSFTTRQFSKRLSKAQLSEAEGMATGLAKSPDKVQPISASAGSGRVAAGE